MSVSGSRAGDEINLDEFERRLRAAGGGQARAEDPLAELSRLVEFSHFGISNGEAPVRRAAGPGAENAQPAQPIETAALRPSIDDEVEELAPGASEADREARQDYEFDAHRADGAFVAEAEEERRPMRWKLTVSALAIAGVAMIGAVFVLKGGVPGLPKTPPFIAAAQGPTKVAPPKSETPAALNDPGGSLLGNAKPGPVKVVNTEEQPVDLSAQASLSNPPSADRQSVCSRRSGEAAGGIGSDRARRHRQYAACGAARRIGAVHAVGIPHSETGAHSLAAARRNPDRGQSFGSGDKRRETRRRAAARSAEPAGAAGL